MKTKGNKKLIFKSKSDTFILVVVVWTKFKNSKKKFHKKILNCRLQLRIVIWFGKREALNSIVNRIFLRSLFGRYHKGRALRYNLFEAEKASKRIFTAIPNAKYW